jgi:nitrogen regulatory protein PII
MADNATVTIANKEGREKFNLLINGITEAMTRKEAEDAFIKETVKQIKADFNIKTKVINAVAKAAHKGNFNDIRDEFSEIVDLYESAMTS